MSIHSLSWWCIVCLLCAGGGGQLIAQTYESSELADKKVHQKTMAILPGLAPMTPTHRQLKTLPPEQIEAIQDSLSLSFQHDVYRWFAAHGTTGTLTIQDPSLTDSLFDAAHLSIKDVLYGEKTNLAQILGVDVLLFATLKSQQDYTDAGMGATPYGGMGPDYMIPTLDVFLTIDLYDGQDGDHLWGYEGDRDGGYYQKYADKKTIDKLISKAYRLYPYKK